MLGFEAQPNLRKLFNAHPLTEQYCLRHHRCPLTRDLLEMDNIPTGVN
jgi:hypothetical protein